MSRLKHFALPTAVATALLAAVLTQCGKPDAPTPAVDISKLSDGAAAHAHTAAILEFGPRPPGSPALGKVRNYLTTTLRGYGWQAGSQKFTTPTSAGNREFTNLIARFGQADDPDLWSRPVTGLLSCHIDSKLMPSPNRFLGADDAASAAGLILEIARQLQNQPERARQIEIIFFDGEEAFAPNMTEFDGLYGSREYAKRWAAAARKPKWGLNLDMIGHRDLHIRYPSDSPPHLVDLMLQAAEAENASQRFYPAPTPILDDHVPLNNVGIPTLDIIGDFDRGNWWHTNRDNLGLISEDSLNLSLRIVHRMLDQLAPAPAHSSQ